MTDQQTRQQTGDAGPPALDALPLFKALPAVDDDLADVAVPAPHQPASGRTADTAARLAALGGHTAPQAGSHESGLREPHAVRATTAQRSAPTWLSDDPAHVPGGRGVAPGRSPELTPVDRGVDWGVVRTFRQLASAQLVEELSARPGIDDADRHELGRSVVRKLLTDHAVTEAVAGGSPMGAEAEAAVAHAVLDSLFGLGRLQPLVDDSTVEDIEITGHDSVVLLHEDGRITQAAPVADSDEELVEFLAFLASRRTDSGERPFSWANPELRLALPGRARLTALAWVTPRPVVRIRMHRHVDVTLDDLLDLGMIDTTLHAFLDAAVRARKSVVVSGAMGSGKTTMTRSLARAIPGWESIGTLETEYELYIDQVGDRLRRPITIEARPGSGEVAANGRAAGELTVGDLFPGLLRQNLDRIIVGEVRGDEIVTMFKAMQSGAGSLSTIHAKDGRDTVDRLATLMHGAGMEMTFAYLQVAQHIDLIVHLDSTQDPTTGRRYRYVAEVVEPTRGDGHDNLATARIFEPGPDGRAAPTGTRPTFADDLARAGFDPAVLDAGQAGWTVGMEDLR